MIKLVNVSKTYKQKGIEVNAIKNVDLTLPSKGLVFIVGRSGSGKSTLLNLIGGLDSFDEGEIIIDNKSMNEFTEDDYNNYRNSYLGFVFQEFNLIEDYSVEKNILLGCNLGSDKEKEGKVKEILKRVDLEGLEKRKPNTLSGGQRQRAAIARALIKEPKLLLCDEPTGQLDYETSESIFKLLKEISKESLVVVVSHDIESAKEFGDYIITIKDGRVENKGIDIEEEAQAEIELKKFKLPIKNYFSLALGFLKKKVTRLVIALVISIIVFVLLGVSDTISSYDRNRAILEAMYANDNRYVQFYKTTNIDNTNFDMDLNDNDVEVISNKLKRYDYDLIYNYMNDNLNYNTSKTLKSAGYNDEYYYQCDFKVYGACDINNDFIKKYGYELVAGRLPENYSEIVITKYAYELYQEFGYLESNKSGGEIIINTYEDMLDNKTIEYKTHKYKIVGILDTKFNYERYGRNKAFQNKTSYSEERLTLFERGLHGIIFFKEGFYNNLLKNKYLFSLIELYCKDGQGYSVEGIKSVSDSSNYEIYFKDTSKTKLEDKEILIPISKIVSKDGLERIYQNYLDDYVIKNFDSTKYSDYESYKEYLEQNYKEELTKNSMESYVNKELTSTNYQMQLLNSEKGKLDVKIVGFYNNYKDELEFNNIALVTDEYFKEYKKSCCSAANDYHALIYPLTKKIHSDLKVLECSGQKYKDYNWFYSPETNSHKSEITYETEVKYVISSADGLLENLVAILKYSSIFLIFIAVAFMCFYFSGLIIEKEKEIGILRAMGASKADIKKIFILLCLLITLISIFISSMLSIVALGEVNDIIVKKENLIMPLYYFGFRQILLIVLIEIFIVLLGIIFPLQKLLNKKTVDIIAKR